MYNLAFAGAIITLLILIVVQLIRLSLTTTKLKKDKTLYRTEIRADKEWEFIKGLY